MLLRTDERVDPKDITTMFNPCAALVPSCLGQDKVVARRCYWAKFLFGNFPSGKPDAIVFRRSMMDHMGLKVVHTFRVVTHQPQHQDGRV